MRRKSATPSERSLYCNLRNARIPLTSSKRTLTSPALMPIMASHREEVDGYAKIVLEAVCFFGSQRMRLLLERKEPLMYEREANAGTEPVGRIPDDVLASFRSHSQSISSMAIIPWSEHCTDCALPACFETCDIYMPRIGDRCRRFVDGIVHVFGVGGLLPYVAKVRFKRWAQLGAVGNCRLWSLKAHRRIENVDLAFGWIVQAAPLPMALRSYLCRKYYNLKKRWSAWQCRRSEIPDYFLLEAYNPQTFNVSLSLTVRPADKLKAMLPYQAQFDLAPGFNKLEVPGDEIHKLANLLELFDIALAPNEVEDGTAIYFGTASFVKDSQWRKSWQSSDDNDSTRTKCVVWDLDNTLWDGVLVEDGVENLRIRQDAVNAIRILDEHGVLNSVASKNNHDEAIEALKTFGLDEYFVHPTINWTPKSQSLRSVAEKLNIGLDTLLFVDDSPFERAEVEAAVPEVRVIDAAQCADLQELPECKHKPTDDSRGRRMMYKAQETREVALTGFGEDYFTFLAHCELELTVRPLSTASLQRVHELAQRTNQMNFSGTRYQIDELVRILEEDVLDTYVMDCKDRFGSYGTVGFGVVDIEKPIVLDLMFSCRVQSKRIEHAFLSYILNLYAAQEKRDLFVRYKKTSRNAVSGKVFEDFEFDVLSEDEGITTLRFPHTRCVPDDALIKVIVEGTT